MSSAVRPLEPGAAVPQHYRDLLAQAVSLAHSRRERLWLVGGFVRDLLLGRASRDLDLVVEGDGPALAAELAREHPLSCEVHPAFLTAELALGEGRALHLASARRESYPKPAALPVVARASLVEDLWRRDFAVNAIALEVLSDGFGELVDPCGGRGDLDARRLRILHPGSFEDDPTRAFRALRFESRLDFELDGFSRAALGDALSSGAFDQLSGGRLCAEVNLLFAQLEEPAAALRRGGALGLLRVIDPELHWSSTLEARFELLGERRKHLSGADPVILGQMSLLFDLSPQARGRSLARLDLSGRPSRLIEETPQRMHTVAEGLARAKAPHQAARALLELSVEERVLLWAETPEARPWLEWAAKEMPSRALGLRGQDLKGAGIVPGPQLGAALEATQDARWDGQLGAEDELAFALEFLGDGCPEERRNPGR